MRCEVVEVATTGNVGLQSPGECLRVAVVQFTRWPGKAYLNILHPTYRPLLHYLLHPLEVGQIAAVVGHKAGHTCLFRHTIHTGTVLVVRLQRLLYINRLSGTHGHDSVGGMTRRWRGHIDGVHLLVINEFLSIAVPPWNTMTLCIRPCFLSGTAHHGYYLGAWHLGKGRATLLLAYLATTYKAPF